MTKPHQLGTGRASGIAAWLARDPANTLNCTRFQARSATIIQLILPHLIYAAGRRGRISPVLRARIRRMGRGERL